MSADAADARIEVSKKGPGIGVREGSADSSWLVLDKNEDGRIVEGNVAVDGEAAVNSAQDKKRPEDQSNDDARDKTDGSPETSEQESGGERTETDNGAGKIKCEVGERVQHSKYRYGVVRWLGEVGGEKMAGVELENFTDGCGSGCLPGSDKPFFSCKEGHGVFCPISELSPDTRAPDPPLEEREERTSTSAIRPQQLFEPGSMVEVKGFGFGVVQWLGKMSGTETAGVELEQFSERGGDGTPDGGAEALFPCQTGYSVFTPVKELVPDSRFMVAETTNPLADVELETISDKQPVPPHTTYCGERKEEKKGVQGEHNSCYIDATLFGLFALSSKFDSPLTRRKSGGPDVGGRGGSLGEEISNTLLTKIINPLRKRGVVRCEPVLELREQLEKLGKIAGLRQEEKDPEEFLNLLFKHALSATPFISIQRPQGEEQEFFVQLFMEPDPSLSLPSIHNLLTRMFSEQNIKFSQKPEKILIQVPRYGKQFKTFQRIIPDKLLDIKSLCEPSCLMSQEGKLNAQLKLLSVVCIETSHYVCFCFTDNHWIFMDSMADRVDNQFNIPSCEDCTAVLEEWVYSDKHKEELMGSKGKNKVPELVRRFTQDIYMCVYVDGSTSV